MSSIQDSPSGSKSIENPTLALEQLQNAIEVMRYSEKAAYLEAIGKAPNLVELESSPIRFLRSEKWDAWAAAKRLCAYWEKRKALFQDRAFRPLSQACDGALNEADLECLNTGCLILLPNDSMGRSVIFFDRSKLKPHMFLATETRLRCLYYFLNVACENEVTQTQGLVVLGLVSKPPAVGFDFSFPARGIDAVNTFPFHIHEIHLTTLPSASGQGSFLDAVLSSALTMISVYFGRIKTHHGEDGACDLIPKLKMYGLAKKSLPPILGGNWDMEKFQSWMRRRSRHEEEMYMTEEQKLYRKRKINVIHSRQKRQRRKIELEVLQEQCAILSKSIQEISKKNKNIENLIQAAEAEVSKYEENQNASQHHNQPLPMFEMSLVNSMQEANPIQNNGVQSNNRMHQLNQLLLQQPVSHSNNIFNETLLTASAQESVPSVSAALGMGDSIAASNFLIGQLLAERERSAILQRQLQLHGLVANSHLLHPLSVPANPLSSSDFLNASMLARSQGAAVNNVSNPNIAHHYQPLSNHEMRHDRHYAHEFAPEPDTPSSQLGPLGVLASLLGFRTQSVEHNIDCGNIRN